MYVSNRATNLLIVASEMGRFHRLPELGEGIILDHVVIALLTLNKAVLDIACDVSWWVVGIISCAVTKNIVEASSSQRF